MNILPRQFFFPWSAFILAASLLLPARSFPAPGQKSPATADEAVSRGDDAFRHNRWTEAEGLYLDAAGRVPRSPRYAEAMRKAGQCRVKLKDYRKARKHFEAATGDARSRKDSPDEAARAFSELHALLLEHGDAAARERVLADFRRALPDSPRLPRAFEREGDACLSAGSHGKAAAFYRAAGSGLSPCGTNILAIAEASRPGASAAVSDDDLRRYAAILAERPELAKPLCDLLASRRDGWRAEDAYASFLLDGKKPAEAAAVWESMLKGRRGPADRIAFRRAEAVASQDSTKGMDALREWLSRHGGSPLRERAEFALAMLVARTAPPTEASAAIEGFLAAYPDSPLAGEAKAALAKAKRAGKEMAKAEADAAARKDAAAKDPFGASLRKAEVLLSANRPQEALPIFRKLAETRREPRWGRAVLGLGRALRDSGDTDAALEAWDGLWRRARAEAGIACAAEARRAMGDALLEDRGDPAKALAAYDEAAARDPAVCSDAAFDRGRAVALLALGRGGEALPQIAARREEAEKGDPAEALRWRRLEALCAAGRAVPPSPSDRPARVSLALADGFFASGDYRAARKRYRAASRLFGDRAGADEADLGEALSLAAAGKAKEALAAYLAFGKNHRGSPLAPLALLRAGTLQASPALGDAKKARKIFERLMADHPRSKEAVAAEFYVATLAWRAGRWAEAKALHEAFVANHPDSPLIPAIVHERIPAMERKSQAAKIDLGTYEVKVGPKDRKRKAIPISSESAVHATLEIRPANGHSLDFSAIVEQDSRGAGALWTPGSRTDTCHTYYLSDATAPDNAFSSEEYVMIAGTLDGRPWRPGSGAGRPSSPFLVTVPSVDIDWDKMAAPADETREDTAFAIVPLNTNTVEDIRHLLVQEPFDDTLKGLGFGRPVDPEITIGWSSRRTMGLLDPGGILHTDIFSLRKSARQAWPMELQVVPLAPELDFVARVEGQPAEGGKAIDTIRGRIVNVDIDIDANGDGAIDDTDEPLETNPGGFVAVGTNSLAQINLKVEPAGLPGKVKLTATGGDRIRLWTTPARTTEVTLPIMWDSVAGVPSNLYVEGVMHSIAEHDVALALEYSESTVETHGNLSKCEDQLSLSVFTIYMIHPQAASNHAYRAASDYNATGPIEFQAKVDGIPYTGDIEWALLLEYKTDGGGPFTSQYRLTSKNDEPVLKTFIAEGGRLTIKATATVCGATCSTSVVNYVTGIGIPDLVALQRLNTLYAPPVGGTPNLLSGIAREESTLRQFFNSYTKYSLTSRWPVENISATPPSGSYIGMMQVPVAKDTAWDWLVNTQTGANIFDAKLQNAAQEIARQIRNHPGLPVLNGIQLENYALGLYGGFSNRYYTPALASDGSWQWIATDRQALLDYVSLIRGYVP